MRSGVSALSPPVVLSVAVHRVPRAAAIESGDPGCPFSNACSESSTIATW